MSLEPRMMIRFHHADAVEKPKLRPATIADDPAGNRHAIGGRYAAFYGSTFKQRGYPRDAIVADPLAPAGEDPRELAEALGAVIDERTYFHGSMMSELDGSDPRVQRFTARFPRDLLDILTEQADELLLAFRRAFMRLAWIQPRARAFVLHALWWEVTLDLRDEVALTLLLYEGLTPSQIAATRWRDIGEQQVLLPRTRHLIEKYRSAQGRPSDEELVFASEAEARLLLERSWKLLCDRGQRARPRIHLPEWSRIPDIPDARS